MGLGRLSFHAGDAVGDQESAPMRQRVGVEGTGLLVFGDARQQDGLTLEIEGRGLKTRFG